MTGTASQTIKNKRSPFKLALGSKDFFARRIWSIGCYPGFSDQSVQHTVHGVLGIIPEIRDTHGRNMNMTVISKCNPGTFWNFCQWLFFYDNFSTIILRDDALCYMASFPVFPRSIICDVQVFMTTFCSKFHFSRSYSFQTGDGLGFLPFPIFLRIVP